MTVLTQIYLLASNKFLNRKAARREGESRSAVGRDIQLHRLSSASQPQPAAERWSKVPNGQQASPPLNSGASSSLSWWGLTSGSPYTMLVSCCSSSLKKGPCDCNCSFSKSSPRIKKAHQQKLTQGIKNFQRQMICIHEHEQPKFRMRGNSKAMSYP